MPVRRLGRHVMDRCNLTVIFEPGILSPIGFLLGNDFRSWYHSFQTQVTKRFSKGLAVLGAYTLSKSIDSSSTDNLGATVANPFNLRDERGRSDWDRRHAFVASWLYTLPVKFQNPLANGVLGGWTLTGIHTIQSGAPLTFIQGDDVVTSRASVGSIVTLWDMVSEEQVKYTLVNTNEANIRQLKISVQSPIGRALVDRSVGDVVEVQAPSGVTLNVRIDRIGSQLPSDGREFQIVTPQPPATINKPPEAFAPAQFFDLTDEQKLTSASFQDLDSGIRVGEGAQLHTGYAAAREVEYEVKYIDSQREQRLSGGGKHVLDVGAFNSWTLQGAIAQSELSFARKRKSSLAPEAVVVSQESFAIVNSGDLKLFDELSLLGSEHAAVARLNELVQTNPTLHNTLQVVPAFELAA